MSTVLGDHQALALLPRVLGILLYYAPDKVEAQVAQKCVLHIENLYPWKNITTVSLIVAQLQQHLPDQYDFSVLFEGQGNMPAPPWAGVYTDPEQLLMNEETLQYRQFLKHYGLKIQTGMEEPETQVGLMLLVLANLIERNDNQGLRELLSVYLLPWVFRYLHCLQQANVAPFYPLVGQITELYLRQLAVDMQIQPVERLLYF